MQSLGGDIDPMPTEKDRYVIYFGRKLILTHLNNRVLSLGAELSPAQEIAFGDDTDQFAFLIEVPASR